MTFWDYLYKVCEPSTAKDILLLLIGAVISIVFERVMQHWDARGTLNMYCTDFMPTTAKRRAHIHYEESKGTLNFFLPLEIEMVNTSGEAKVVRELTAVALYDEKVVARIAPIHRLTSTTGTKPLNQKEVGFYGGMTTSYTYLIKAHECVQTQTVYLFQIPVSAKEEKVFNRVDLVWFDAKGDKYCSKLMDITECWEPRNLEMPESAQLLEYHKCKY